MHSLLSLIIATATFDKPRQQQRVTVIGSSVANGGGLKAEEKPNKAYTAVLTALLSQTASLVLHSKNAVGPSYFTHCT